MADLTQAHKASIEVLGTRHTALVESVRNYVNGSVRPSIDELIAAVEEVTTDIDTKEKMLLGLVSRQATKPVPSLILDFKTRNYLQGARRPEKGYGIHDLLTVERSTRKWVYNASGKLVEVPAHEPAYQHDPVTGESLGLLIEESKTNLHLYSADMTNAGVTRQNCDITVSSEVSPIIGQPAFTIKSTTENVSGVDPNVFSVVAGQKYTATVIAKAGTADGIGLVFKHFATGWRAGTVNFSGVEDTSVGGGWTLEEQYTIADGWTVARVSFVANQDSDRAGVQYRVMNDDSDGAIGDTIHVAHWQIEEGEGSSIIPTTDSQVTRAGDSAVRVLGEEVNSNSVTVVAEFRLLEEAQKGAINEFLIINGEGHTVGDYEGGAIAFWKWDGTPECGVRTYDANGDVVSSGFASSVNPPAIEWQKAAIALNQATSTLAVCFSGEYQESIPTDAALPSEAQLFIREPRNGMSMQFRSVAVYPYALTEQELIELTS